MSTQTQTETETKSETKVNTRVLTVVRAYLKQEGLLESKHWPMVDEALDQLSKQIHREAIVLEFRKAFEIAYAEIKAKDETTYCPMLATLRRNAYKIVAIAAKGEDWIKEMRAKNIGFHAVASMASNPDPVANDENIDSGKKTAKPSKADKQAKPSKHKKSGNVNVHEGKEATTDNPDFDPDWESSFDATMEAIQERPALFVRIVKSVLETAVVPVESLEVVYNAIGKHLKK